MISIELPVGDINFDKMQTVCGEFKCRLEYTDKTKSYFKISSEDAQNIFWLGMNLLHKLDSDDLAAKFKKEKPWLYK